MIETKIVKKIMQ